MQLFRQTISRRPREGGDPAIGFDATVVDAAAPAFAGATIQKQGEAV